MAAKTERDIKMAMLTRLNVEFTPKIADDRLNAKLSRALESAPEDFEVSADEKAVIKALGFDVEEPAKEPAPAPKKGTKAKAPVDDDDDDSGKAPASAKKGTKAEEPAKEPAPAPKKGTKAKKADGEPRMTRFKSVCAIIKKRKNHTVAQIVEESDELYIQHGGKGNQKEAMGVVNRVLVTLVEMEIVSVTDDNKVKVLTRD